jgi:hypothetical protein
MVIYKQSTYGLLFWSALVLMNMRWFFHLVPDSSAKESSIVEVPYLKKLSIKYF